MGKREPTPLAQTPWLTLTKSQSEYARGDRGYLCTHELIKLFDLPHELVPGPCEDDPDFLSEYCATREARQVKLLAYGHPVDGALKVSLTGLVVQPAGLSTVRDLMVYQHGYRPRQVVIYPELRSILGAKLPYHCSEGVPFYVVCMYRK
jgi:hypothetical protein